MQNIKPVKRPSVGEQVCEQLKEYLFEGKWLPGEKIPSENELAQAFQVSRVTIREAVLRLASLGLLESRFGGGTYVCKVTPGLQLNALIPIAYLDKKSILDVIEYRQVFEARTSALAARRAEPENITTLEEILARMERYKLDQHKFAEADLDFHMELARITQNSLLIETMNIIKSILSQAMFKVIKQRGHSQGLAYHRLLIDSISVHDEKLTMRIMEEHIDNTYEAMRKALEQEGVAPFQS